MRSHRRHHHRRPPVLAVEALESRVLLSGRIVGYFPDYRWSFFDNIDWEAVTHVNYFAISANSDGSLSTGNINLNRLNTAVSTAHSHGNTVSITVGPHSFSTIAASPSATANFVNNLMQFVQTHNLDGVDIDWEPRPTGADITRYGTLIDALHAQMSPHNLKLTIAAYPNHQHIPLAAAEKLDWINVMAYNFSYADHTTYDHSINSLVGWSSFGVPREKLLLGIPLYGRQGTSWQQTSTIIYRTLINNYVNNHGSFPPPEADFADGWYFNGVNTVQAKAQYVVDHGYGGVMIWEIGQDHHDAQGQPTAASLMPVIKSVIHEDPEPLAVIGSDFVYATAPQRVQFQFTRDVSSSLHPSRLVVRNIDTQATIIVSSVQWDTATRTATFSLNSIVPDGSYTATLDGGAITDGAGNPLGEDYAHEFHFLAGDANGDGIVNLADFNILAANFGQTGRDFTQGDFNYDGVVNLADFNILAASFGTTVGSQTFSSTPLAPAARQDRVIDTIRDDALD